jgi:hypothetical protein
MRRLGWKDLAEQKIKKALMPAHELLAIEGFQSSRAASED